MMAASLSASDLDVVRSLVGSVRLQTIRAMAMRTPREKAAWPDRGLPRPRLDHGPSPPPHHDDDAATPERALRGGGGTAGAGGDGVIEEEDDSPIDVDAVRARYLRAGITLSLLPPPTHTRDGDRTNHAADGGGVGGGGGKPDDDEGAGGERDPYRLPLSYAKEAAERRARIEWVGVKGGGDGGGGAEGVGGQAEENRMRAPTFAAEALLEARLAMEEFRREFGVAPAAAKHAAASTAAASTATGLPR
jgi:hypothetical protein